MQSFTTSSVADPHLRIRHQLESGAKDGRLYFVEMKEGGQWMRVDEAIMFQSTEEALKECFYLMLSAEQARLEAETDQLLGLISSNTIKQFFEGVFRARTIKGVDTDKILGRVRLISLEWLVYHTGISFIEDPANVSLSSN